MVKLSFILPSARDDYCVLGMPDTHVFEIAARSLEWQTSKDFELIHVDNLHRFRPDWWKNREHSFPVTHIPPKPGTWVESGMCNIAGAYNTGLVYANGKYVCILNDSNEYPPNMVADLLGHLDEGYRPQVPLVGYTHGFPNVLPSAPPEAHRLLSEMKTKTYDPLERIQLHFQFHPLQIVADQRYQLIAGKGPETVVHTHNEWFWPSPSAPLEDFLLVNGYDELFDGVKSLDDCDIGIRMGAALGKPSWLLSKKLWFVGHYDTPISDKVFDRKAVTFKNNIPILRYSETRGRTVANRGALGPDAKDYFLTIPNDHCRKFHFSGEWGTSWLWDHPHFLRWWNNPPNFDLRVQRERLRAGANPWSN